MYDSHFVVFATTPAAVMAAFMCRVWARLQYPTGKQTGVMYLEGGVPSCEGFAMNDGAGRGGCLIIAS